MLTDMSGQLEYMLKIIFIASDLSSGRLKLNP